MKNLYVFGNEHLEFDLLAKEIASEIKGYNIINCTSPDIIMDEKEEIIILDVVKGIKNPILINNVDEIKFRNILSMHDFDLGFFLKLYKELGMLNKFKIIGIPSKGDKEKIVQKVRQWV